MTKKGITIVAKTLKQAILDLNEDEAKQLLDTKLASGENPHILVKQLREGVNLLIQKYKDKKIGIVELGMASRILQKCLENLRGCYEGIMISREGRVAIGTIQSDHEDISHELLATILFGTGFDIFNLGGNLSPVLSNNDIQIISPDILVLSGLDEDSIDTIIESILSFKKSGIKIPMIVGPRIGLSYIFTIDNELQDLIPADDFINDLAEVSDLARNLVKDGN